MLVEHSVALEKHLVSASPQLRMTDTSNYSFPASPFSCVSSKDSLSLSLLLIPQGKELESFFQHICLGVFFCETSEKPMLTTTLMQDSRDELY